MICSSLLHDTHTAVLIKNVIVKGMNLQEGATTILRNGQIGGHAAGDDKRVHSRRGKDSEHPDQHSDDYPAMNNIDYSEEDGLWQKE